jgi:hypothetical protein
VKISSQSAALTAQENTEQALRGVLNSAAFIAESQGVADGLSSLSGSSESCSTISTACPSDSPDCVPSTVTECTTTEEEVTTEDLMETRQEMYDALDEFVQLLREEIFVDDNLEEEDSTHAVYRIPASVLCSGEDDDSESVAAPAPSTSASTVTDEPPPVVEISVEDDGDDACEEDYDRLQPRLRLSSPGKGDVDVEILLTEEKRNPITLQLYHDRLGVLFDLGEFKSTVEAAGEDLEDVSKLKGVFGLELVRHAATDYSVRLNIIEAFELAGGEPGEEIEVNIEPSSPSMEVRLDGEAKTITGTYDWGAMNLMAPLAAFMDDEEYDDLGNPRPPKDYTGTIEAVLGGLNGSLTFDGSKDVLLLEGLGLGDVSTSVAHDGNPLLQLDINPDDGRRFDLKVAAGDADDVTLTFTPTLDVRLMLAFQHLADQVEDIEEFLLDDAVRFWFEGDGEASVNLSDSGVAVVDSTLHIESTKDATTSVSVEAGMCLVGVESDEPPASIASAFTAGVCE